MKRAISLFDEIPSFEDVDYHKTLSQRKLEKL